MKSLGIVLLLLAIFLGELSEEAINLFHVNPDTLKNESSEIEDTWFDIEAENSDGESLVIYLPANHSTGYEWVYTISDPDLLTLTHRNYQSISASPLMGSGEILCLKFVAKEQSGSATLTLSYQRLWEAKPIERRTLELTVDSHGKIHISSVSSEKNS